MRNRRSWFSSQWQPGSGPDRAPGNGCNGKSHLQLIRLRVWGPLFPQLYLRFCVSLILVSDHHNWARGERERVSEGAYECMDNYELPQCLLHFPRVDTCQFWIFFVVVVFYTLKHFWQSGFLKLTSWLSINTPLFFLNLCIIHDRCVQSSQFLQSTLRYMNSCQVRKKKQKTFEASF